MDRPQYDGDDAVVLGIDHVGSQVIVGGRDIDQIIQGDGSIVPGANLSATAPSDPSTVTWFAPVSNPSWWDIQRLGDGHDFIAVGARGAWRFDLRSQTVVWHRALDGTATTVSRIPGTGVVLVGGSFSGALIALNAANGKTADYTLPAVTGRLDVHGAGPTKVYRGETSPDGRWYVGLGMFTGSGTRTVNRPSSYGWALTAQWSPSGARPHSRWTRTATATRAARTSRSSCETSPGRPTARGSSSSAPAERQAGVRLGIQVVPDEQYRAVEQPDLSRHDPLRHRDRERADRTRARVGPLQVHRDHAR